MSRIRIIFHDKLPSLCTQNCRFLVSFHDILFARDTIINFDNLSHLNFVLDVKCTKYSVSIMHALMHNFYNVTRGYICSFIEIKVRENSRPPSEYQVLKLITQVKKTCFNNVNIYNIN